VLDGCSAAYSEYCDDSSIQEILLNSTSPRQMLLLLLLLMMMMVIKRNASFNQSDILSGLR